MGSFYGNISHSNKTAIQFDKIYHTRTEMDAVASSDGIFIGRYVLIDYDEVPISGYYYNSKFYTSDVVHTSATEITGAEGIVYLDLKTNGYYTYNTSTHRFVAVQQNADGTYPVPYVSYYNTDVQKYGRGYDSTAWVKIYQNNVYKYVMVAELNTVVPSFHLVAEAPADAPIPPYFDANVTNLDYYMHVQSAMINTINSASEANSDETIAVKNIVYGTDSNGYPTYTATDGTINGDVFFNKKGFDPATRTYSSITNSLNYSDASSGRRYGITPMSSGTTANDIHKWHIRFPAIGNVVCTVWDTLYSTDATRKRAFLKEDSTGVILNPDGTLTSSTLFTTSPNSILGVINDGRKRLGMVQALGSLSATVPSSTNADSNIVRYKDSGTQRTYYMPQYSNVWTAAGTASNPTGGEGAEYYAKVGNVYLLANLPALDGNTPVYIRTTESSGKPYLVWPAIYTATNKDDTGTDAVNADKDSSGKNFGTIYGAIAYIHKLLGTHLRDEDSRDDRTVIGLMNRMKDMVHRIDTFLPASKWLITDESGTVISSPVPYTAPVANGVLEASGNWVARFKTIGISQAADTAVSNITTNTTGIEAVTTNSNKVTFKAGNIWITLAGDNSNKAVTFAHKVVWQTSDGKAFTATADNGWSSNAGTWNASNGNSALTIPSFTWDNAGHIISVSSTKFYLPYSFKQISIASQNETENALTANTTAIVADSATSTTTFGSGNQWIVLAGTDSTTNKILFGHKLSSIESFSITPSATGWGASGNELKIPNLSWDKAGHIISAGTTSFYLPNFFKTIKIAVQSIAVTELEVANNITSINADKVADTFTFATGNKWIRQASIDSTTNTLTIAHALSPVTAGYYGLATSQDITALNTDNVFEIPYFQVDEAGHVISAVTNTVTIPENFTTIAISAGSSDTTDITTNTNSISANSLVDQLNFLAANKWIHLAANTTNKTVSIAHETHTITATTIGIDFNSVGTFTSDEVTYDNAGHLVSYEKTTYTLPYNFKTIAVINSDSVNAITPNEGSIVANNQIATATMAAGNKWIQFAYDSTNRKITVGHAISNLEASTIQPTIANVLSEEIGPAITLPIFATDNAGHVISTSTVTYYIPYTFKTVDIAAQSTVDSGSLNTNTSAVSLVADTITDTLTFKTVNKWIRLSGSADNDSISIGHYVNDIAQTTVNESFNGEIRDFDNDFEVDLITFDAAGHITSKARNGYKLPYGFKTITLKKSEGATSDMTAPASNSDSSATTVIDTFSFIDGNKWIVLNLDPSNKELSIGHKYSGVGVGNYGLAENVTNANSFTVPYFTVDLTGHITAASTQTVTVPNNFTTINVNDGTVTTAIVAATTTDTLSLGRSNNWITLSVNEKSILVGHQTIFEGDISNKGTANSPTSQFGMTFKVPYLSVDQCGHVTALTDTTITIPKGSLVNNDSGNVITNASYTQTSGTLTVNKNWVGNLLLNDYTAGTDTSTIGSTDSINVAFAKIQAQITAEINARTTAITTEVSDRNTAITNAIDTEVTNRNNAITNAIDAEVTNRNNAIDTAIATEISDRNNAIDTAITTEISNRNDAITTAIDNLSYDALLDRVNGLENADTISDGRIDDLEIAVNGEENTPENGLLGRVTALESIDINALITVQISNLFANYEITLKAPTVAISNAAGILSVIVTGVSEDDTLTYQWQKESTTPDEFEDIVGAINDSYDTENTLGKYLCIVTRTLNGQTRTATSTVIEIE